MLVIYVRATLRLCSMLEITDTYHDTDVWCFYRAGYALRVRNTYGDIEAPA